MDRPKPSVGAVQQVFFVHGSVRGSVTDPLTIPNNIVQRVWRDDRAIKFREKTIHLRKSGIPGRVAADHLAFSSGQNNRTRMDWLTVHVSPSFCPRSCLAGNSSLACRESSACMPRGANDFISSSIRLLPATVSCADEMFGRKLNSKQIKAAKQYFILETGINCQASDQDRLSNRQSV